jgi:DNA repair protein RecN (Recombination protein N)
MSLQRISLKDFVIVDELALDLGTGFTALTGETGAGKSILIDALQLALGDRADAGVVREGQLRAEVSVEFGVPPLVRQWLDDAGIGCEGDELLVRRTVDTQGRSRGWVNGTAVTATQLRELGALLVDIHGQHAWQGLMKADSSCELLDAYGHIDTQPVQACWAEWQQAKARLSAAEQAASTSEAERERLLWQLAEADKLAPQPNEWASLQEEHTRLANVVSLTEAAHTALGLCSEEDVAALGLLAKAQQALEQRLHQEPRFAPMAEALAQASLLTEETVRDLQAYLRHTEADPARLEELDQRLNQWMSLSKRHRCTPEELPGVLATLHQRLAELDLATDLGALAAAAAASEQAYANVSQKISHLRHDCKQKLATEITNTIQQLGMAGGVFEVQVTPLDKPQASGVDRVEFLVAGHVGMSAKPVAKVASGGELSRLSLAIAVATSQVGGCPTLIFDEVDSGIGGTVAHTVGQLMARLGQGRQVLAVTHLAQVAACAHHHVQVSKHASPAGVKSGVRLLSLEDRVTEVARMLGGSGVTEASVAHAREMLNHG